MFNIHRRSLAISDHLVHRASLFRDLGHVPRLGHLVFGVFKNETYDIRQPRPVPSHFRRGKPSVENVNFKAAAARPMKQKLVAGVASVRYDSDHFRPVA